MVHRGNLITEIHGELLREMGFVFANARDRVSGEVSFCFSKYPVAFPNLKSVDGPASCVGRTVHAAIGFQLSDVHPVVQPSRCFTAAHVR